jgi:hypothetical protein
MAPSACSHLSLPSGIKMCGIAIEYNREVMDILKSVLDGKCAADDLLPELLKINKGKLIKGILTLIPRVVACDTKIDKLERKVENTSLDTSMLVIICLVIIIK